MKRIGPSLVTHHFRWAVDSLLIMVAGCGTTTDDSKMGDLPDASSDSVDCRPTASADDSGGATACSLPFDPGPCHAAFPVFAFVDGACVERVYGGCEGNANRFPLLERCMVACEGRPDPCGCPPGRVAKVWSALTSGTFPRPLWSLSRWPSVTVSPPLEAAAAADRRCTRRDRRA
jgi:hypothetical protein